MGRGGGREKRKVITPSLGRVNQSISIVMIPRLVGVRRVSEREDASYIGGMCMGIR